MSYQVLARKWRPRTFHQLVGQEHVARALINALDQGRLHHAYLFTGTRGVGKTTIARIFAKCLNCETGITSSPCGECEACRAIDEGRFVDLIEVDAASRTKVEDTRELLDNVQYAPTQGRFKVYLIDEVHMLSSHSFNALLKTLEEPPPHVKFLLATTDPQKLPITVLSRCLQFALKAMPPERVVEHLTHILGAESVGYDEQALWLLGRAADGSMRDALSLTDQAIAFGHGRVSESDVRAMLGTLDHRYIISLGEALASIDAAAVLGEVARLAEQAPDFAAVLDELSALFHRLAIAQMVPNALDNGFGDREALLSLAGRFRAEDVQLFYQIALGGRAEMVTAPDPRAALEMTLLRMLAFRPQGVPRPAEVALPLRAAEGRESSVAGESSTVAQSSSDREEPEPASVTPVPAAQASSRPVVPEQASSTVSPSIQPQRQSAEGATPPWSQPQYQSLEASVPPWREDTANTHEAPARHVSHDELQKPVIDDGMNAGPDQRTSSSAPVVADDPSGETEGDDEDDGYAEYAALEPTNDVNEAFSQALEHPQEQDVSDDEPDADAVGDISFSPDIRIDQATWLEIFPHIALRGISGNLIANCIVMSDHDGCLELRLDPSQAAMNGEIHSRRLEAELKRLGTPRNVTIMPGDIDPSIETPHKRRLRLRAERRARAVEALKNDPHIRALQEQFGARLLEESVRSLESEG